MNTPASLSKTAALVCVQHLFSISEYNTADQISTNAVHVENLQLEYFTRLLETGCFTAVSAGILQRMVRYYPLSVTDRLLLALLPPYAESLNLNGCFNVHLNGLVDIFKRCPHLRYICLSQCTQLIHADLFTFLGLMHVPVTKVVLEDNQNVTDEVVHSLIRNLPCLDTLNISSCSSVSDNMFLVYNDIQLSTEVTPFSINDTRASTRYKCSLTNVDISGCGVTTQAIQHLTFLTGPNLKHLNLSWTHVDCTALLWLAGYTLPSICDILLSDDNLKSDKELSDTLHFFREVKSQCLEMCPHVWKSSHDDGANTVYKIEGDMVSEVNENIHDCNSSFDIVCEPQLNESAEMLTNDSICKVGINKNDIQNLEECGKIDTESYSHEKENINSLSSCKADTELLEKPEDLYLELDVQSLRDDQVDIGSDNSLRNVSEETITQIDIKQELDSSKENTKLFDDDLHNNGLTPDTKMSLVQAGIEVSVIIPDPSLPPDFENKEIADHTEADLQTGITDIAIKLNHLSVTDSTKEFNLVVAVSKSYNKKTDTDIHIVALDTEQLVKDICSEGKSSKKGKLQTQQYFNVVQNINQTQYQADKNNEEMMKKAAELEKQIGNIDLDYDVAINVNNVKAADVTHDNHIIRTVHDGNIKCDISFDNPVEKDALAVSNEHGGMYWMPETYANDSEGNNSVDFCIDFGKEMEFKSPNARNQKPFRCDADLDSDVHRNNEELSGIVSLADADIRFVDVNEHFRINEVNDSVSERVFKSSGSISDSLCEHFESQHEYERFVERQDKELQENMTVEPTTDSNVIEDCIRDANVHKGDTSVCDGDMSVCDSDILTCTGDALMYNGKDDGTVRKCNQSACQGNGSVGNDDTSACKTHENGKESSSRFVLEQYFTPQLCSLNLIGMQFMSKKHFLGQLCIAKFFNINRTLQRFAITWKGLTGEFFKTILPCMKDLQHVDVEECTFLSNVGVAALANSCTKLASVNLRGVVYFHDVGLVSFLSLKYLTKLSLAEGVYLTDISLKKISKSLAATLTSLDLSWCEEVTEKGINAICAKCSQLKSLTLRKCPASDFSLQLLGQNCSDLEELSVESVDTNGENCFTDVGGLAIAEHLTNLRVLDIGWNLSLTDLSVKAIMRKCCLLEEVYIKGLKQITVEPFLPIISGYAEDTMCTSNLPDNDVLPQRSTVFVPNLCVLDLHYSDLVNDRLLQKIVNVCRGSLHVTDYYGQKMEPEII